MFNKTKPPAPLADAVKPQRQAAISAAQVIGRIEKAMTETAAELGKLCDGLKSPPDREAERIDLLTELALGEKTSADLEKLEQQISTERAAAEKLNGGALSKIKTLQQTLAGLESRLEKTKADFEAATQNLDDACLGVLDKRYTHLSGEFAKQIKSFVETYAEMAAIGDLLSSSDRSPIGYAAFERGVKFSFDEDLHGLDKLGFDSDILTNFHRPPGISLFDSFPAAAAAMEDAFVAEITAAGGDYSRAKARNRAGRHV